MILLEPWLWGRVPPLGDLLDRTPQPRNHGGLRGKCSHLHVQTHDGSMVLVYMLTLLGLILMGSMAHHI